LTSAVIVADGTKSSLFVSKLSIAASHVNDGDCMPSHLTVGAISNAREVEEGTLSMPRQREHDITVTYDSDGEVSAILPIGNCE